MKPGDTTTIYEDPVTRHKPEGQAKLVKLLQSHPDGSQDWRVIFHGEDTPVQRRIYPTQ
jgi:hypothetical protein